MIQHPTPPEAVAGVGAYARWLRRVARLPSAVLLAVQLAGVVLYALMEDAGTGRVLVNVFGLVVLGAAVWMVRRSPAETWIGGVLAGLIAALLLIQTVAPGPTAPLAIAGLESAFYFYAAGSMTAYMLQDERATTDELFAAGATFTLLAWAYAHAFTLCQALVPGSFGAVGVARTWMEMLFLAFTILSGVGLGDMVPLTPMARALVMLAQFTGLMYIALVVSRLIGLTLLAKQPPVPPSPPPASR